MSSKRKLTELLAQFPPDTKKLMSFSRSKKGLDFVELGKLVLAYNELKKEHGSVITPLLVACWTSTKLEVVRILINEGWKINSEAGVFGSPVAIALEVGNISTANMLIELGADIKRFYRDGSTAMMRAMSPVKKQKTCVAAVKLLVDSGVSVNSVVHRSNKERPIHVAVVNKLPSVVSFVLQKGADPNVQDINGNTPMHIAVHDNDLNMVKLFLLHGVDLYKENIDFDTPLTVAVKKEYTDIITELVQGGYDINKPIKNGKTAPIHSAIFYHKAQVVKLLITLGGDPNNALPNGLKPLHVVAGGDFIQVLFKEKEHSQGRKDIAEYLVDNGADINASNSWVDTPLQIAVVSGFLSLAKLLIKLGGNVNVRNIDGDHLFHQAVKFNRDIIIYILEFGGDYQTCDTDGMTPYHVALSVGVDLKYIQCFAKHGCPYDQNLPLWSNIVKNNKKIDQYFAAETNFFKGIKENNLELVKNSVKDGAVPSSCSEEMKYPLHFVALNGYSELLTYLLKENVPPNSLNKDGETPLHLAASEGHYKSCRILLRHGACYNYHSKKCPKTPKMVAHDHQHKSVVDLLDSIEVVFRLARSKKKGIIEHLRNELKNDVLDYLMSVRAIDMKGNTVLTTALNYKRDFNAEEILKLRLQF